MLLAIRGVEQVSEEIGHRVARDAMVDAEQAMGAESTVVDDAHQPVVRVSVGDDHHHAGSRVGGGRRQGGDLAHVGRPRQRPLHQEQLVDGAGRSDRVDALRSRPR